MSVRIFTSVDMNKNYIYIFMGVLCQRDNVRTLTPSGRYPNDNIPTLFNYTLGYIRVLWDSIQKKHKKKQYPPKGSALESVEVSQIQSLS